MKKKKILVIVTTVALFAAFFMPIQANAATSTHLYNFIFSNDGWTIGGDMQWVLGTGVAVGALGGGSYTGQNNLDTPISIGSSTYRIRVVADVDTSDPSPTSNRFRVVLTTGGNSDTTINQSNFAGEHTYIGDWYPSTVGSSLDIQIIIDSTDAGTSCRSLQVDVYTNAAPNAPSSPTPPNNAQKVSITSNLSWSCSDPDGDSLTYDVYFKNATPPVKVASNQTATTYDPGTLEYNTTHYWKIVAWDSHGASSTSSLWSFTTIKEGETPNNPPTCNLTATPSSGNDPLTLNFSMSAADSDGTISLWSLDVDNDGTPEYSGSGSPPATQQHIYTNSGTYTAKLTVTDNNNATGYKTTTIIVSHHSGWFTWKLPFSWFSMFTMIFIGLIGIAVSAFFLKPESIKAIGYAPAAGSLLTTVLIIGTILMYHAGFAWYWIAGVVLLLLFILYTTIKIVTLKKKRLVKSIFKHKRVIHKKKRRR